MFLQLFGCSDVFSSLLSAIVDYPSTQPVSDSVYVKLSMFLLEQKLFKQIKKRMDSFDA